MTLYADICRDSYASDEDIKFDDATKTWSVRAAWGADAIPGIPDKELALAIARAIYAAWNHGNDVAYYS